MSRERNSVEQGQMEALRQLVLGRDNQLIRATVKQDARELVGDVLTEALHDRQKTDGSIGKVLTPLVEKSVETSVTARKEQFVGYLYPLVGSLVRKSVSAYLAGLMERTNQLLESSLTLKGLKWRFKAWQAGVSYPQYVVSQTFLFRVEQVLLIHRETGLLLNTVVRDKTQATDGDMVSAMLTAINDFVSDSFSLEETAERQSLDEIKTDNFTLVIKQGPQAVLVAAITGNTPADVGEQLQLTLEEIHRIYGAELKQFNGDASALEASGEQMAACLLAQEKADTAGRKKTPWLAILMLAGVGAIAGDALLQRWQQEQLVWKVEQLPAAPGLILLSAKRCEQAICIDLLRDPIAEDIASWLAPAEIPRHKLKITQRVYRSLAPELAAKRLQQLAADYPELQYRGADSGFYGELSTARLRSLRSELLLITHSQANATALIEGITVAQPVVQDSQLNDFLLQKLIDRVEQTRIEFASDESEPGAEQLLLIGELSNTLLRLSELAYKQKVAFQVAIMGASDSLGSPGYNQSLSEKRAAKVRDELIRLGVEPGLVSAAGLGMFGHSKGARTVAFAVITL